MPTLDLQGFQGNLVELHIPLDPHNLLFFHEVGEDCIVLSRNTRFLPIVTIFDFK